MNDFTPYFDEGEGAGSAGRPPSPQEEMEEVFLLAHKREARRASSRLGLALAAYGFVPQLLAVVLLLTLSLLLPAPTDQTSLTWALQVFCLYLVGVPLFFAVLGTPPALPPAEPPTLAPQRISPLWLLRLFCMLLAVSLFGSLIGELIGGLLGNFGLPVEDTLTSLLDDTPLLTIFLVVVVLGPIAEELVYRLGVMRMLLPYGERAAILLSGLFFGLIHGNIYQLFYAMGGGILLGYLYVRTRRLLYPILMHVLFNFFGSFLPLLLLRSLPIEEIEAAGPAEMMELLSAYWLPYLGLLAYELLYFGMAVAGVILLILFWRRAQFAETARPLPRRGHAAVYLLNMGMLLFLAFCALILASSFLLPG